MKILETLRGFYSEEDSKASNSNLFLFSQEELETKLFPLSPPEVCSSFFDLMLESSDEMRVYK